MARIQMGVIVTDIRGKLAGNQFSKTRAGNILQRKCSQRKGATPAQASKRAYFSEFSRFWRTLTDAERLQNNTNTSSYPIIDKFGNTTYLSGYQLLLRSNINLQTIEESPITVVPGTPPAGAGITPLNAVITVAGGVVTSATFEWDNPTGDYANKRYVFYVSPGVSQGVSVYNGRFILYGPGDPADLLIDFTPAYVSVLPIPGPADKVFMIMDLMDIATGIVVNSYRISTIVNPPLLSFDVTLTSGVSYNFFAVFGDNSSVVPAGYEVQLSLNTNVVPAPADPTILSYSLQDTVAALDSMNPYVIATAFVTGATDYIYWRMQLVRLSDSMVVVTDYDLSFFTT